MHGENLKLIGLEFSNFSLTEKTWFNLKTKVTVLMKTFLSQQSLRKTTNSKPIKYELCLFSETTYRIYRLFHYPTFSNHFWKFFYTFKNWSA